MIFDQYVKLFNISWIEPWMIEALAIIVSGLILMVIVYKAMDCFKGEDR